MSKIIIHNNSSVEDWVAIECVKMVLRRGKISGDNQYCWASQFHTQKADVRVIASPSRGDTHTFKVVDLSCES